MILLPLSVTGRAECQPGFSFKSFCQRCWHLGLKRTGVVRPLDAFPGLGLHLAKRGTDRTQQIGIKLVRRSWLGFEPITVFHCCSCVVVQPNDTSRVGGLRWSCATLSCWSERPTWTHTCKHFVSYAFILLISVADGRFRIEWGARCTFRGWVSSSCLIHLCFKRKKNFLMHLSLSVNNSGFSELWSVMIMADLGCTLKRPFRGVFFCWLLVEMTVE